MTVNKRIVTRVMNKIRAIEANARVSKVLFRDLEEDVAEGVKQAGAEYVGMPSLKSSIDSLIDQSEYWHARLFELAQKNGVDIPGDEDPDVIIVPQGGGGGKP